MNKLYMIFGGLSLLLAAACGGGQGEGTSAPAERLFASQADVERAVDSLNRGAAAGAVAVLDSLVERGRRDTVEVWRREISIVRGYALNMLGEVDEARRSVERGLSAQPVDTADHKSLFRDYAYAAAVFYNDEERTSDVLAWCRLALGHAAACERAGGKDPGSTFVSIMLGDLYVRRHQPVEALEVFDEAVRRASHPAALVQACNAAGHVYIQFNLFEEADHYASLSVARVASGEVSHPVIAGEAYTLKAVCMVALKPDSAAFYLLRADSVCGRLPYNLGQEDADEVAAYYYAIHRPDSIESAKGRLRRVIGQAEVEEKRQRAVDLLRSIESGETVSMVTAGASREGALARSLIKLSEKMRAEEREKRELERRSEVMGLWIIAITALALFILSVMGALLVRYRHRERLLGLMREHAEREERMRHDLDEAERRRVVVELSPESFKETGFDVFRSRFAARYPGALERLLAVAENLGAREQLLCMLLILGVDGQRLADLLAIAPDSVKKGRQRVRRKLGLRPEQDLTDALRDITRVRVDDTQVKRASDLSDDYSDGRNRLIKAMTGIDPLTQTTITDPPYGATGWMPIGADSLVRFAGRYYPNAFSIDGHTYSKDDDHQRIKETRIAVGSESDLHQPFALTVRQRRDSCRRTEPVAVYFVAKSAQGADRRSGHGFGLRPRRRRV